MPVSLFPPPSVIPCFLFVPSPIPFPLFFPSFLHSLIPLYPALFLPFFLLFILSSSLLSFLFPLFHSSAALMDLFLDVLKANVAEISYAAEVAQLE